MGDELTKFGQKREECDFEKIPQKIHNYIGSQMGDELKFGEILVNFWARGEILKSCEAQNGKGV